MYTIQQLADLCEWLHKLQATLNSGDALDAASRKKLASKAGQLSATAARALSDRLAAMKRATTRNDKKKAGHSPAQSGKTKPTSAG